MEQTGGKDNNIAASFLTVTLGLVIIAIPIQLKLYGIPIAWSMEGAVLFLLGIRFRQIICRAAGLVALILAAGGLLYRLPLHSAFFTPIFNIPFASWSFVIAMAAISAYQLHRNKTNQKKWHDVLTGISFLLAFLWHVFFSASNCQRIGPSTIPSLIIVPMRPVHWSFYGH